MAKEISKLLKKQSYTYGFWGKMRNVLFLLAFSLPCFAQITGTVVNSDDQTPIEGAIVRIQKQEAFTTTDVNGQFTLNDTATLPFNVTAAAFNFYNGFAEVAASVTTGSGFIIELDPIDTTIIEGHPLNPPGDCASCHPQQHFEWASSPMGKTGLNKWVFDLWNGEGTAGGLNGFVYKRDSAHRFASPNSDCSACHSPVHWLTDIENAGMGDIHNPTQDMTNSVQCEVCHRAYDLPPDKTNFPGVDPEAFVFLRGPQHLEFGLLGDAIYQNEIMRPAYNPLLSAQLCAACHEDNNDHDDDGDYEDEGSVPHETTFSEWELYKQAVGEANAKSCIECHMPFTNATQFCIWEEEPRREGTIRKHDIRGTTPEFLENAVTMTATESQTFDNVSVQVQINNETTGHSVPTGILIRNMLLLVQVRDENGQLLTQTSGGQIDAVGGIGDPAQGYYANQPGHAFYLNQMDPAGAERVFYTEAVSISNDSRLKPGTSFQDTFVFDLGSDPDKTVDVDVRLIYRRSYRDLIDQKGWTQTGLDQPLADLEPPHYGHLMERVQLQINVCAIKDVDGSQAINNGDILAMNPMWGQPAPFCAQTDPITNMKHFASLVNCIQ